MNRPVIPERLLSAAVLDAALGVGRDLGVGVGLGGGAAQTLKKIGSWLAKGRPKGTPFPVKAP